jgi:hypothetical protein
MNAQILKLAEEAKCLTGWPIGRVELEQFAQLIIQECVSIIALHGVINFENEDISLICAKIVQEIKQHFGVEE